jgi:hypothetical protein
MTVMIAPVTTRTRVRSKATATKRAVQRTQVPQARPSIHQQAPQTYEAQAVQRAMSVSNLATPIGTNFFDRCGDEIMSLHYGQQLDLLDWMGFEVSDDGVSRPGIHRLQSRRPEWRQSHRWPPE